MATVDQIIEIALTAATIEQSTTTAVRTFVVAYTDPSGTALASLTATDGSITIPIWGSGHPDNASLICSNIDSSQVSAGIFEVTCDYSTFTNDFGFSDNPISRPADVAWTVWSKEEVIEDTIDDPPKAVNENSAGEVFQNPIVVQRYFPQVTITRNERDYNPATAVGYFETVNSDNVIIQGYSAAAKTALLTNWTGVKAKENGRTFWRVTYTIRFNPKTWTLRILDVGLNERNPVSNLLTPILDEGGEPLKTPHNLDGFGGALAFPNDPEFLKREIYIAQSFNFLGLR